MVFFKSRKAKVAEAEEEERDRPGGWYSDPYGAAARRWYDNVRGWTDRVQGAGEEPDKTASRMNALTAKVRGPADQVDSAEDVDSGENVDADDTSTAAHADESERPVDVVV
jgi:hypothetical protein